MDLVNCVHVCVCGTSFIAVHKSALLESVPHFLTGCRDASVSQGGEDSSSEVVFLYNTE